MAALFKVGAKRLKRKRTEHCDRGCKSARHSCCQLQTAYLCWCLACLAFCVSAQLIPQPCRETPGAAASNPSCCCKRADAGRDYYAKSLLLTARGAGALQVLFAQEMLQRIVRCCRLS
jgi:hypothetical protein